MGFKLPQILFELGGMDRYEIVRFLSMGERRPSEIAERMGLSRPETSRHLSRLEKVGLIEKSPKGYKATMMGELAIQHTKALSYVIGQYDYFLTHMWEILPKSLLYRVHVLEDAEFLVGVTYTLRTLEKMIASTQEHFSVATGEMPHSLIPPALDRLAKAYP